MFLLLVRISLVSCKLREWQWLIFLPSVYNHTSIWFAHAVRLAMGSLGSCWLISTSYQTCLHDVCVFILILFAFFSPFALSFIYSMIDSVGYKFWFWFYSLCYVSFKFICLSDRWLLGSYIAHTLIHVDLLIPFKTTVLLCHVREGLATVIVGLCWKLCVMTPLSLILMKYVACQAVVSTFQFGIHPFGKFVSDQMLLYFFPAKNN